MPARSLLTKVSIKADRSGNAPSEIELLRTGTWHTPWHGDFEITLADLHEFAANFAKGVGLVEADKKAPINYAHESWDKAAAWVPKVRVDEDREALVAYDIEWTDAAITALKAGEWRYISPEFNPRGFPWEDPEAEFEFVDNVLTGAALTNIPLFKKLKPIMASRVPSKPKKADVTSGDGNKPNREGDKMNLEDIRKKQVADLTDEEKTFLGEHKDELTDDERTAFGLVEAPAEPETPETPETPEEPETPAEPTKVQASAVTGVQISQDELDKLRADAEAGRQAKAELEQKKAEDIIGGAIKAGQIKSGDKEKWVKQLLASRGESRTALENLISTLPKNEELGKELGDKGQDVKVEASVELDKRVRKIQADARAEGKQIAYSAARAQVLDADANLKSQLAEEEQ
ncbi:phage protease [Mycolicibacterium wolinskyi]|uniref:phage protease n=1 Tax=Mycolicibacterium wolinskyi TaxID=59750 RepID=UPI003917684A